jgi:hypothetical protein
MRLAMLSVMVLLAGGCASQFDGEWVEENPVVGQRPMALKFEPPATIRYGSFNTTERVVDSLSEQSSEYFLFDGNTKAQFGSMIAHVEGDHLLATQSDRSEHKFDRVHGKSIFPPDATLPDLSRSDEQPSVFVRAN